MSRRRGMIAAATAAVAIAGCGGQGAGTDDAGTSSATATRPAATVPRAIERREAEAQAGSAAAQDAARQDYSIPPTAFAVRCLAPGKTTSSARWTCALRSRDRRCRGTLTLVLLADGSTQPRGELRCRGPREWAGGRGGGRAGE